MKIKRVELDNYKRFTSLVINEIPETARLVVLIGPNGAGKSSLFDAFLLKSQATRGNYDLTRDDSRREYYIKQANREFARVTQELANRIKIEFHEGPPPNNDWSRVFNIRTAYRVEADFRLTTLAAVAPSSESPRFTRIIDPDQAVSDNNPHRIQITFDDPRLVANAGLLLPATLARHLGLPNSSGSASTWAMPRGGRTRATR